MGKTRDLFKKVRDTKGTFHAKMYIHKPYFSRVQGKAKIFRSFLPRALGKHLWRIYES